MWLATELAKEFVEAVGNKYNRFQTKPRPVIYLMNGDVIHFITASQYTRWCVGREYMLNGVLFRSGFPVQKGDEQ
jgi:hypothetical protein